MQETRNNCFGSKIRSTTLRQAKTGKHECFIQNTSLLIPSLLHKQYYSYNSYAHLKGSDKMNMIWICFLTSISVFGFPYKILRSRKIRIWKILFVKCGRVLRIKPMWQPRNRKISIRTICLVLVLLTFSISLSVKINK